MGKPTEFRCYFLDGKARIAAAETIDAATADSAVSLGLAMLMRRRQAEGADLENIEIWLGARKVYP
jgi:hypothetical protein